jgi:diguanylate cyclase (GGDEF)-like protein
MHNAVVDEAERLLRGRTRDIRLGAALRRAYRDRSFKQTSKIIRSWMAWVAILDVLAAGTNFLLLPWDAAVAMLIPSAFVLPATALVHVAWRKRRPDAILDWSLVIGLSVILLAVALSGAAAGYEFQERYATIMLFVSVSAIIIFNVPIWISSLVSTIGLAIYLVLQLLNPLVTTNSTFSAFFFLASGVIAMVVGRRTTTLLSQRTFLLELRDARRAHELKEMNRRLDQQAKTDPLTGLPNRRYMEETLATIADWSSSRPATVAMLMCDIDYFKGLNDHLGHTEGDRCLVEVGATIAKCLRPGIDHVARFGGEEFLVVLHDLVPAECLAVAERIRLTIASLDLPNPGARDGKVSVSIGVAASTLQGFADIPRMMQEADTALYAAKRAGRNCVMPSEELGFQRLAVA